MNKKSIKSISYQKVTQSTPLKKHQFNQNEHQIQTQKKIESELQKKRNPWSKEEDQKLKFLVSKYSRLGWKQIGFLMQDRTGKQCRQRWTNHLDEKIDKNKQWSLEQLWILFLGVQAYGKAWSKIRNLFDGRRSDNTIKNTWNSKMKKYLNIFQTNLLTILEEYEQNKRKITFKNLKQKSLIDKIIRKSKKQGSELIQVNQPTLQNIYESFKKFRKQCYNQFANQKQKKQANQRYLQLIKEYDIQQQSDMILQVKDKFINENLQKNKINVLLNNKKINIKQQQYKLMNSFKRFQNKSVDKKKDSNNGKQIQNLQSIQSHNNNNNKNALSFLQNNLMIIDQDKIISFDNQLIQEIQSNIWIKGLFEKQNNYNILQQQSYKNF